MFLLVVIESLYFSCYYAYLLGNLKDAGMYYAIIKDEFRENGRQDSLERHQLLELKKIKTTLETGNIAQTIGLETPIIPGPPSEAPSKIFQKELVRKIHVEGLDQLKKILKDDVYLYNLEHPCGIYGNVDMVFKGLETIYPVEVKKDQAKHDLIGQINKYALFHKLHLHLKHYKYVQPLTICQSYLPYVLKDLKQLSVITLGYRADIRIKLFVL